MTTITRSPFPVGRRTAIHCIRLTGSTIAIPSGSDSGILIEVTLIGERRMRDLRKNKILHQRSTCFPLVGWGSADSRRRGGQTFSYLKKERDESYFSFLFLETL
jgi:hypothetical protein